MGNSESVKEGNGNYVKQEVEKSGNTEVFPITKYKNENILFLIAACHAKVYDLLLGFWNFFTKNRHLISTHYDQYLQVHQKTIINDITPLLDNTPLPIEAFAIFQQHIQLLSQHKWAFTIEEEGEYDDFSRSVNLFAKEKDSIEHLISSLSKPLKSHVTAQREYVGALVLWLSYETLPDALYLRSFGLTISGREPQDSIQSVLFDARIAVLILQGISSSLVFFNLFTLDHAKSLLQDKMLTVKDKKKDTRRYLLRICLDQPGHYQILHFKKTYQDIEVNDIWINRAYMNDSEKSTRHALSMLFREHQTVSPVFFLRPRNDMTIIQFKGKIDSLYDGKRRDGADDGHFQCISCGDDNVHVYEEDNRYNIYCHPYCQVAYHFRFSLFQLASTDLL